MNRNYQIELFNCKREIHNAYILIHFNKTDNKITLVFWGNLKYSVHSSKHEMPVPKFELQTSNLKILFVTLKRWKKILINEIIKFDTVIIVSLIYRHADWNISHSGGSHVKMIFKILFICCFHLVHSLVYEHLTLEAYVVRYYLQIMGIKFFHCTYTSNTYESFISSSAICMIIIKHN